MIVMNIVSEEQHKKHLRKSTKVLSISKSVKRILHSLIQKLSKPCITGINLLEFVVISLQIAK